MVDGTLKSKNYLTLSLPIYHTHILMGGGGGGGGGTLYFGCVIYEF